MYVQRASVIQTSRRICFGVVEASIYKGIVEEYEMDE